MHLRISKRNCHLSPHSYEPGTDGAAADLAYFDPFLEERAALEANVLSPKLDLKDLKRSLIIAHLVTPPHSHN